jgi:hypothetical protein
MGRRDFPGYVQTQARPWRQMAGVGAAVKPLENAALISSGNEATAIGHSNGSVFRLLFDLDSHGGAWLRVFAGILKKLANSKPQ